MSTSNAPQRAAKTRPYRLGKRAATQQETRKRIVEAAIDLHGTIGPARTSVREIAERAGVQRHTYYAHFPDERSLMMACSGLSLERDPLPDPDSWLATPVGAERLEKGLREIYAWYERNARMAACVLRDAEHHKPTREAVELRMGPPLQRAATVLSEGLSTEAQALLAVALDFACWRTLASVARHPARLMSAAIAGLE
jgi:AcrR family transcriptional regulator